jgi:oxygen-independent coproporphyrinogen-3 oxidase
MQSRNPPMQSANPPMQLPDSPITQVPDPRSHPLGLYIHIPFCSAICNYCNFNRGLFEPGLKDRYVRAVHREIGDGALREFPIPNQSTIVSESAIRDRSAIRNRPSAIEVDSIYFGGGTPSLLEPEEVARLIDACSVAFDLATDVEITLEANPETVTEERLRGFRAAGVNRLSFGVQSFRDQELRRLSRLHGAARARAAIAEARRAGFDNLSIDLMMWLPGQQVDEWLESVDAAIALVPDHLSLYLLELYPNAPLRDEMARAHWSQAPDGDAEAMYLTALDRLESAGLAQYEISNVARPRRQSRHNLKYWQDGAWLGFGCGAHSTWGGMRWKNISSTEEYVARLAEGRSAAADLRVLPPDERLGDALFTGLRLVEGLDLARVRARYGVDVWERYRTELEPFVDAGLLLHEPGRLRLTRRGMLLAHEVMAVFV